MNKYFIFYHKSDLDGKCSGAIADRYFHQRLDNPLNIEHQLYPLDYYDELPLEEMNEGSVLYFLDIFPQPYEEKYNDIISKGVKPDNIIVCDHHKTFLDSEVSKKVKGNSQLGLSGCELTYMYFHNSESKWVPTWVRLLGRYDVWDKSDINKWENEILPFQYGARSRNTEPCSIEHPDSLWSIIYKKSIYELEFFIDSIIREGKTILENEKIENKRIMDNHSFDALFNKTKCLVCNTNKYSSQVFESKWDPLEYYFMMPFSFVSEGKIRASLYTTHEGVDVSTIAKSLGGGGHKGAAGFVVDKDTFFDNLEIL